MVLVLTIAFCNSTMVKAKRFFINMMSRKKRTEEGRVKRKSQYDTVPEASQRWMVDGRS